MVSHRWENTDDWFFLRKLRWKQAANTRIIITIATTHDKVCIRSLLMQRKNTINYINLLFYKKSYGEIQNE